MTDAPETIDFGAPTSFGAHIFRVEIGQGRTDQVTIVEDFGYQGGEDGRPYEEPRAIVLRATWSVIGDAARRDFNERLKEQKATTGRWRVGVTKVERLLGKELCVLAWASEGVHEDLLPVVCARWAALRPEERWWLFSMTVAEAGLPEDGERGWRKALTLALSDAAGPTPAERRRRPRTDDMPIQLPLLPGSR